MVGLPIDDDDIEDATAALDEVADGFEEAAGPGRRLRAQPDPVGHPQEFFPTSPVIGFANPVAPPVVVEAVDGELRGTAYLRLPVRRTADVRARRGHRHGVRRDAGRRQHHGRKPGHDRDPHHQVPQAHTAAHPASARSPLHGTDGRKIRTFGAIYNGDALTAEAEGIFIELVPQRFLDS